MSAADRIRRLMNRGFRVLHAFLYRRGLARRFLGAPAVLVTTTGRKSGRAITTPLISVRDGASFVVIASNGGADRHPVWWLNLLSNPEAIVEAGSERIRVRAEEVSDPNERDRLWRKMAEVYPGYDGYTRKTKRIIPLALLRPIA
jgi:deazaflavin-dependent oxidoreductase (nitroreductase family)